MSANTKIARNSMCPCGSGKKFKKCCINKSFKWSVDESGNYTRSFMIKDPELMESLKIQRQRFIDIYGREPQDDDLVFFDQYVSPTDEKELEEMAVKLLKKVNVNPSIIHAFKKTGRLLVQGNEGNLTDAELKEWNQAIEEYYQLNDDVTKEEELLQNYDEIGYFNEFESVLYLIGMIISKNGQITNEKLDVIDFVMFCITKSFKTLKSIQLQIKTQFIEDALSLIRSVYENYLNITYLLKHPEKLDDLVAARIGLADGTCEYLKNGNGKIDKRTIINIETGQRYSGHISNYTMAKSSEFNEDVVIFDILYERLSNFTHPSILVLKHYMIDGKFNPHHKGNPEEVIILSLFCSFLLLERLLETNLPQHLKNDIEFRISRLTTILSETFYENILETSDDFLLQKSIYNRVVKIK